MSQLLEISQIRRDGGTQARAIQPNEVIDQYADKMVVGENFPPVVVFHDGENYWLADGFMRVAARSKFDTLVDAEVMTGTLQDAVLWAVKANDKHGLPRTTLDKVKAIQMYVGDPVRAAHSYRQIAEACLVSHSFVSKTLGEESAEREPGDDTETEPHILCEGTRQLDSESSSQNKGEQKELKEEEKAKRVGKDGRKRGRPVKAPKAEKVRKEGPANGDPEEFPHEEFYRKYLQGYKVVITSVDEIAYKFRMGRSPKKEGLVRRLKEFHADFRKFVKELTKKDLPRD